MLSVASFHSASRADKTFAVAVAVLALVAAAQLIAVVSVLTLRHRNALPAIHSSIAATSLPAPAATPNISPATAPALAAPPRNPPAAASAPIVITPAEDLVRQAKRWREQGDTTNAIAKLQQAVALEPKNAEALAEMALTYESMQFLDRSNETWRRLDSLGPEAGPLHELAELKLKVGVSPPAAVGLPGPSELGSAAPTTDTQIPDGSAFGISEVAPTELAAPEAETKLLLRVGVKARPNTPVDHTKVKIQVFFYDVVDNNQVVLTDADVSYQWITPDHNWSKTDTEVLDVTYLRLKKSDAAPEPAITSTPLPVPESVEKAKRGKGKRPAASLPPPPGPSAGELLPASEGGERKYLGYIVRVYYKEQLQAVRADPTRLLNLFPPPFTAPVQ
jgi:tetratricopeptide (TPR) repeat protein